MSVAMPRLLCGFALAGLLSLGGWAVLAGADEGKSAPPAPKVPAVEPNPNETPEPPEEAPAKPTFFLVMPQRDIDAYNAISEKLENEVTLDFDNTPLTDVAEFLSKQQEVGIHIDAKALSAAGVSTDQPVSCKAKDISLRAALGLALSSSGLTWVIRNESLVITTLDDANAHPEIRVYPVRDLVTVEDAQGNSSQDYKSLLDVVRESVQPASWTEIGGAGTIKFLATSGSLIVSQPADVQREISALLETLRKARDAG